MRPHILNAPAGIRFWQLGPTLPYLVNLIGQLLIWFECHCAKCHCKVQIAILQNRSKLFIRPMSSICSLPCLQIGYLPRRWRALWPRGEYSFKMERGLQLSINSVCCTACPLHFKHCSSFSPLNKQCSRANLLTVVVPVPF